MKAKVKTAKKIEATPEAPLLKRKGASAVVIKSAAKGLQALDKSNETAPTRKKSPKSPKINKEDLNFSVTPDFRRKFKVAAKEAGRKKTEFLQLLLGYWQEQNPPQAAAKS